MAGPTTEILNEDLKELLHSVHALEVTVTKELGDVRGEIRELRADVRSAIRVAEWGMGIVATVVVGLVVFAVSASWYASKLDSRVGQIERAIPEAPKR